MKNENMALVELLLQFLDLDIQTADSRGISPVSIALGQGNTVQPYAKYLLSLRGSYGLTPLESALVVDSPAVIDRLLDYQDHAVHEIVRSNQFDFLDKILDVRTRLLDKHLPGFRTPLAAAAWAGNTRSMELILDKGADINLRDRSGRLATPLWIATSKGDLNMARLLVDRGADIELMAQEFPTHRAFDVEKLNPFSIQPSVFADSTSLRDRDSWKTRAKPIWVASSLGYTDIVSFLIQRGADIEARDSYFGMTPFWRAA
ncbi:hypothetical protein LA080_000840 [Diaporthe eres]|nr:hypothetical protein LA080_000840 [Diaporthe eres]